MDSDDGVKSFLDRVWEMNEQHKLEDKERSRKIEEEILASQQARKARRAEVAKSLSPTKDTPYRSARSSQVLDPSDVSHLGNIDIKTPIQTREEAVNDALERLTGKSAAPKESTGGREAPLPESNAPWQRRPDSRGAPTPETRNGSKNESFHPESEIELRRSQIARNLGSKDISFFKQTSDRKVSPEVLLKGTDEGLSTRAKTALPGMASQSSRGPQAVNANVGSGPEPAKRPASFVRSHKSSPSMNSAGFPGLSKGSLFPTSSSMRFEPGSSGKDVSLSDDDRRQPAMSPSQGRIFDDRKTPSPTKGMGSFVQNAMLKREGSINKRWSATLPGTSLPRTSSPVFANSQNTSISAQGTRSRESSPAIDARPSTPEPVKREVVPRGRAKSIVAALSTYSTSGIHPVVADPPKKDVSPPSTPSKTYDQRRWTNKESWLEAALKKNSEGSSPVLPKSTPVSDPTVKPSDYRPPTHPKPANLPSRSVLPGSVLNVSSTSAALNQVTSSPRAAIDHPPSLDKPIPLLPSKKPPPVAEKPSTLGAKPVPGPRVELDFRGNLKPRNSPSSSPDKEDLPFLNAMLRLRSTKKQNYVAPNELKETILAGKAALQDIGPPKPKPPDPVREKLLSAKEALKRSDTVAISASAISSSDITAKTKPPPPTKQISRRELEKPSSLADKRMPNLANLLSKGPPSLNSTRNISANVNITTSTQDEPRREGKSGDEPLTHLTKSRARGPKRRQPTKVSTQEEPVFNMKPATEVLETKPALRRKPSFEIKPALKPKPSLEMKPVSDSRPALHRVPSVEVKPVPAPPPKPAIPMARSEPNLLAPKLKAEIPNISDQPEKEKEQVKAKPAPPPKSPLLSAIMDFNSSPNITPIPSPIVEKPNYSFSLETENNTPKPPAPPAPEPEPVERPVQPPPLGWLARRSTTVRVSSAHRAAAKAVKDEKPNTAPPSESTAAVSVVPSSTETKSNPPQTQTQTQARLPPRLPTVEDEDDVSELRPTPLPVSSNKPKSNPSSEAGVRKVSYNSIPNHTNELNGFFKDPEPALTKVDVDLTKFLPAKKPEYEKVETVKLDVWEVTGNGKVQAVGQGKEHILYDENMYMCLHIYEKPDGQKDAEFYLWSGNQVAPTAVDDAQAFAQKMAEENDAPMVLVRQGRETPSFLNALGGTLVIRRGNSKSAQASPYILCGRSLFDGIVFDEEDLKNPVLCSGFPFLIHSGQKLYLWKGQGSSVQELEYARRVAADFDSEGYEEADEGNEPEALLDFLKLGQEERAAAKYWAMKPAHSNYAARLFRLDTRVDPHVIEISPFCQKDIETSNIYVLDAFFELYIVLGASSQSKRAEFQAALHFTQEYSKYAHSHDGRPFLPPTFVLLGGVSREFRAAFRSWQQSAIPTMWSPARKPSLRVVELKDAMRVMGVEGV
ncbi:hypothetical protein BDZ91DRAFT_714907 [Kalaharituber pfeilii]|nr:hypothetical protein BDZ91DRAFT_714907 [Kalaharituber pfeilii]